MFRFQPSVKPNVTSSTSPPNIKLEPQTGQVQALNVSVTNSKAERNQSGCSSSSSVMALSGIKDEIIVIEESQPLFDDCSETFLGKLDLRVQADEFEMSDSENKIANHLISCKQCKTVSFITFTLLISCILTKTALIN